MADVEENSRSQGVKTPIWTAGTLVYTKAGIIGLFALLLAGDFFWSMRDRSVGPMAQWYLKNLGVPNLLFGLLIASFPALISLIFSPIISVKSDRHRSKRGRRVPFLLITTPIAACGMIGLGLTPIVAKWLHAHFPHMDELTVAVLCFGIFWAAFELATVTVQSVFGGLINDVVPKPILGRFYGLFRAVSLIDGMIFHFWITGLIPSYFTTILLIVGVAYGVAFVWICLKIKEGEYPPPSPITSNQRGPLAQTSRYFRECFGHTYYNQVFLLMTLAVLGFLPVNIFGIPYSLSLGISMNAYGKALALTYLISLLLSFFLGWLVDLFHPLRMVMATLVGYVLVTLAGSFYVTTPLAFLITLVLHGVLSGCYFTCAASLGQRLFPHARYAQFASAAGMILALGTMLMGPLVGTLIDATGSNYRYTFIVGCGLSSLALLLSWNVYRMFNALGGVSGYSAPEENPS